MRNLLSAWTLSLLTAISVSLPVAAQQPAYPTRPITMVVGFPPGGISDVLARALANRLSQQMGQSVVIDNRPGAGTTIASALVANAAPDGYTLYFQDITTHAISASAYSRLRFDSMNDFTPVSLVASTPLMLVASLASGAKDVKTLVSEAKRLGATPLAYASSGNGAIAHLTGETFKKVTGIEALHVPYKGGAPSIQAVLSGEVAFSFSSMPPAIMQARADKLNALAVTTSTRVAATPEVPTLKELGIPMEVVLYSGVLAPKNLPRPIVDRLNAEVGKALASPELRQTLINAGADARSSSPAELGALLKEQAGTMAQAVKLANVTLD